MNIIHNASKINYTNGKTIVKNFKSIANTMHQIALRSKSKIS